jgi:glycosyltransferase involved in cell wall biosynthesis
MGGILNRQQKSCCVLHVVGSMNRGGAENWLMGLLRKVNRNSLAMDFCALLGEQGTYAAEIKSLGGRVFSCRVRPLLTFAKRLERIIREGKYNVVHCHTWLFSGVVLRIAHRCGVPVRIAYAHTTRDVHAPSLYRKFYGWMMRRMIMKHATHCLACSSEAASALFTANWQSISKCRLLYTGIDIEAFQPGQKPTVCKSDFGIPSDACVVGHVGSFRPAKNHSFFLDIASEFVRLEPRAYFFLAGDGELRREAEQKAERLGIKAKTIFAGNRQDVPQLMMNVFDVLLFPSIYEGMPLTLVEAAAAGLRAICSDVITPEATNVLPEAFTRLSLELGAEQWALAVNEVVKRGRMPHEDAYQCVEKSHFSDSFSLRELKAIYGCDASYVQQ